MSKEVKNQKQAVTEETKEVVTVEISDKLIGQFITVQNKINLLNEEIQRLMFVILEAKEVNYANKQVELSNDFKKITIQ